MANFETDPLELTLELDEIVFKEEVCEDLISDEDITDLTGPDLTDDQSTTISIQSVPVVYTPSPTELDVTQCINPVAVVCTKRLDDMDIFKKDLERLSMIAITECIILESLPLFPNVNEYNKREKNETSFKNVVEKVNQINNIAFREVVVKNEYEEEVRKRNRKLLEMCKPVKIILKRVELPKPTNPSAQPKQKTNSVFYIHSDTDPCLENPSASYLQQFQELKLFAVRGKGKWTMAGQNFIRQTFFLFIDSGTDQVDGYYVDSLGNVTEFFNIDGKPNYEHIISYTGDRKVIKLTICCWYKREELIKSLWVQLIPHAAAKFMRKLHKCVPGYCKCCCRIPNSSGYEATTTKSTPTTDDKIIIKQDPCFIEATEELKCLKDELSELSQDKSIWLQKLIKNNTSNTLINKALKYTRPKCQETPAIPANNTPISLLLYFEKWENEMNCYELTQDGNVVTHLKERGYGYLSPNTVKLHKACEDYMDRKEIHCVKSCCWYSQMNCQLEHTKLLKAPLAMKYMRKSHSCPRGHCICCCRDTQNSFIARLRQISLPEHAKYVENLPRKTYGTNNKPINTAAAPILPNLTKVLPYSLPIQVEKGTNTQPTTTNTYGTAIQKQKTMECEKTANASQDKVVDSLISTILDRFQDVRLTINSDGKVAAALSTPVSNLSTSELKVLADILSHAQEQVKALGLGPGANLNQHLNLNQNIKNTLQSDNLIKTMQPNVTNPVNRPNKPFINSTFIRPNNVNANVQRPQQYFMTQGASISANAVYKSFSDKMYQKNLNFNNAFKCHLQATASNSNLISNNSTNNSNVPRIENVFSLKDMNTTNAGEKRKSVDKQSSSNSKIRVLSPTNLNTTPVMMRNPSQTQTFQINSSMPQSSAPQPTIMINNGTIQLVPQTNMLQQMLINGTNLSNANMVFPQSNQMNTNILIPQTVPVSNAVDAAQIQYNTPLNVISTGNVNLLQGTNPRPMQMPIQTVNNIRMAGSIVRVNEPSKFDSSIKMTPVLLKQAQLHNEMATLQKCNPIATNKDTPNVQMTEPNENDEVKTEPQESTDELPPDEKIVIEIDEDDFDDAACILGM